MKPAIAYLGPRGTYTEKAARMFAARLGVEAELVPFQSFADVFDSVEAGTCEYGVVAMENSIEGAVTATLDAFASRSRFRILGEQIVDINHCLLAHPDTDISQAKVVASHGQGLAQCRNYLRSNLPNIETITASSTAEAARMAMEDKNVLAIANAEAAKLYGAHIVAQGIQDHAGDQTSFALIAGRDHKAVFTGSKYKTSLALFLKSNRAGALMMILSEFAYANINLTKIQSRPTKRALGEYMFFLDVEASLDDEVMQTALQCLELKIRQVKVLGCYPVE